MIRNRSESEKIFAHFLQSPRKKIFIDYLFFFTSPHSLYSSTTASFARDKNIFKKHLRTFHFLRESKKAKCARPIGADSILRQSIFMPSLESNYSRIIPRFLFLTDPIREGLTRFEESILVATKENKLGSSTDLFVSRRRSISTHKKIGQE